VLCARNKTVCAYLSFSMSLDELLFLTKDSCLEFGRLGLAFVTEKVSESLSLVASKRIKNFVSTLLFFSLLRV